MSIFRNQLTSSGQRADAVLRTFQQAIRERSADQATEALTELITLHPHGALQQLLLSFLTDVQDMTILPIIQQHKSDPLAIIPYLIKASHSSRRVEREEHKEETLSDLCEQFRRHLKEKDPAVIQDAFQLDDSKEKLEKPIYRSKAPIWFIFQQLHEVYPETDIFMEWYKELPGKDAYWCWLLPLMHLTQPPAPQETTGGAQSKEIKDKRVPEISSIIMNENFMYIDTIYRSRMTLLDIMDMRGYDIDKYRKFSPAEAADAAHAIGGLGFTANKRDDPNQICHVRYVNLTNQRLESYFRENVTDDDSERTEMIIMMDIPLTDRHHIAALRHYTGMKDEPNEKGERLRRKLRVFFFNMEMIVINPLRHVLVPKHEIVPEEKHKDLLTSLLVTSKFKLPEIKFHTDPIARCIGAIPGDIVKITRPSVSAGETVIYRVCAP